jgi:hypothetical protein
MIALFLSIIARFDLAILGCKSRYFGCVAVDLQAAASDHISSESPAMISDALGKNLFFDRLVQFGKNIVNGITGNWESCVKTMAVSPLPSDGEAVIILDSKPRGNLRPLSSNIVTYLSKAHSYSLSSGAYCFGTQEMIAIPINI